MKTIPQILSDFQIGSSQIKSDVMFIRISGLDSTRLNEVKNEFEMNGFTAIVGNNLGGGKVLSVQVPVPGSKNSDQFLNSSAEMKIASGNDKFLFHPSNLLPPSGNL